MRDARHISWVKAARKDFQEFPEDVQSDISLLLLLTPDETKASMVNFEFDDPLPSRL